MEDFTIYFGIGTSHIMTLEAMDHILFVAALCLRYLLKDWKKIVILVTAFTIGHSITLALSALGYVDLPSDWIEFLIPLTIAATCINNLFQRKGDQQRRLPVIYFFALFFGLIHGLAFAGTIVSLEGADNLAIQLLAFNLGIEVGQLIVVASIMLISFLLVEKLKIPRLICLRAASVVILAFSVIWAIDRFPLHKNFKNEKAIVFAGSRGRTILQCKGTEYPEQPRLQSW